MKFCILLFIFFTGYAYSSEKPALYGVYKLSSEQLPSAKSILVFKEGNKVYFEDHTFATSDEDQESDKSDILECVGEYTVQNMSIQISLKCQKDLEIQQKITIKSETTSESEFKANISSSLFEVMGLEGDIEYLFERIPDGI